MGIYLRKPIKTKESEDGEELVRSKVKFGLTAMQGWRRSMEDAHLVCTEFVCSEIKGVPLALFGVFDGHGGPALSVWVARWITSILKKQIRIVSQGLESNDIKLKVENLNLNVALVCEALQRAFSDLDELVATESGREEIKIIHQQLNSKAEKEGTESQPEKRSSLNVTDNSKLAMALLDPQALYEMNVDDVVQIWEIMSDILPDESGELSIEEAVSEAPKNDTEDSRVSADKTDSDDLTSAVHSQVPVDGGQPHKKETDSFKSDASKQATLLKRKNMGSVKDFSSGRAELSEAGWSNGKKTRLSMQKSCSNDAKMLEDDELGAPDRGTNFSFCTAQSDQTNLKDDETSVGEASSGETSFGEPSAGEPSAGEPSAGEPSAGETSLGGPSAGETSLGEPSAEEPSTREPSAVQMAAGQMYDVETFSEESSVELAKSPKEVKASKNRKTIYKEKEKKEEEEEEEEEEEKEQDRNRKEKVSGLKQFINSKVESEIEGTDEGNATGSVNNDILMESVEDNAQNNYGNDSMESANNTDYWSADVSSRQDFSRDSPELCGTTSIVTMLIGGDKRTLVIANAGDSRAVLCRNRKAYALSKDHKPTLKKESDRILKAGGKVINGRVDGSLSLSRALGDLSYKNNKFIKPWEQKVSCVPDIKIVNIEPEDEFIILACDGIWDCLTNQQAVDLVYQYAEELQGKPIGTCSGSIFENIRISEICEKICERCVAENPLLSEGGIGCDNMTIMIVSLNESKREGSEPRPENVEDPLIACYGSSDDEENSCADPEDKPATIMKNDSSLYLEEDYLSSDSEGDQVASFEECPPVDLLDEKATDLEDEKMKILDEKKATDQEEKKTMDLEEEKAMDLQDRETLEI